MSRRNTLIALLLLATIALVATFNMRKRAREKAEAAEYELVRTTYHQLPGKDTLLVYRALYGLQLRSTQANKLRAGLLKHLEPFILAMQHDPAKTLRFSDTEWDLVGTAKALARCTGCGCGDAEVATFAENYILEQLKAPSTAEFGSFTADRVKRSGDRFIYSNHVDAQNSFGATLRRSFTATILCRQGTLYLVDFSMPE